MWWQALWHCTPVLYIYVFFRALSLLLLDRRILVDPCPFVPSYYLMLCFCSSITWLDGVDALDLVLTA